MRLCSRAPCLGRLLLLTRMMCGSSSTTARLAGGGRWTERWREFSLASASQHARQSTAQEDKRLGHKLISHAVHRTAPPALSHASLSGPAYARHDICAREHGPNARCAAPNARRAAWGPGPYGAWHGTGNADGLSSTRLSGAAAASLGSLALAHLW
jgi:hypothetical protein